MKLSLRLTTTIAAILIACATDQANAITVISNAIEDVQLIPFNANNPDASEQNRGELLLNDALGTNNRGRYGVVRFDTNILGGNDSGASAFTDASQFSLVSATLRLTEQAGRDGLNGDRSGRVGAYFFSTLENSDWSITNRDSLDSGNAGSDSDPANIGTGWFGNSSGRNGNLGGNGFEGDPRETNVDERSNGAAPLGQTSPEDFAGTAFVQHTFVSGDDDEVVEIDLTTGGASLFDIQSLLADWVAGNNAGIGLTSQFEAREPDNPQVNDGQVFFQSNSVDSGVSVESSIDGDTALSGNSADEGLGADGPGAGTISLILEFEEFDGLRGDFNNDLAVNAADFTLWRDSVGAATDEILSGNGDSTAGVSLGDYTVWQQSFGASAPASVVSTTAVPEPSAVVLLGVLLSAAAAGTRSRS